MPQTSFLTWWNSGSFFYCCCCFLAVLGFEFRASSLLGGHSVTWATLPALCVSLFLFKISRLVYRYSVPCWTLNIKPMSMEFALMPPHPWDPGNLVFTSALLTSPKQSGWNLIPTPEYSETRFQEMRKKWRNQRHTRNSIKTNQKAFLKSKIIRVY